MDNTLYYPEIRKLVKQNLSSPSSTENIHTGIYGDTRASRDYFVVVACIPQHAILSLTIADTLIIPSDDVWEFEICRHFYLFQIINSLNQRTLKGGVHELYDFPSGMIYAYKQTLYLPDHMESRPFCTAIQNGILQFDEGICALKNPENMIVI